MAIVLRLDWSVGGGQGPAELVERAVELGRGLDGNVAGRPDSGHTGEEQQVPGADGVGARLPSRRPCSSSNHLRPRHFYPSARVNVGSAGPPRPARARADPVAPRQVLVDHGVNPVGERAILEPTRVSDVQDHLVPAVDGRGRRRQPQPGRPARDQRPGHATTLSPAVVVPPPRSRGAEEPERGSPCGRGGCEHPRVSLLGAGTPNDDARSTPHERGSRSRIHEVQDGAPHWARVELIDIESGEADTLRSALESFGLKVDLTRVGQARHLVDVLRGGPRAPFVVLACHGADGGIVLPELAAHLEVDQPFSRRLRPAELASFSHFDGATVISTGCDTGQRGFADAVLGAGAGAYLAPAGGPYGYAALFALTWVFYELTERRSLDEAVRSLTRHDRQLSTWTLHRR